MKTYYDEKMLMNHQILNQKLLNMFDHSKSF